MKLSGWVWNASAVAVLGIGGLTMTQFAATQDTDPAPPSAATQKSQTDPSGEQNDTKSPPTRQGLSKFMRMKLEASQKVLAGLALEDYELIQEGAAKLEQMSTAEKWRVSRDPLYREHSIEFQRSTQRLVKNAKDGKLEAAALSWLEATMQCIECHKWSRANLVVADEPQGTKR